MTVFLSPWRSVINNPIIKVKGTKVHTVLYILYCVCVVYVYHYSTILLIHCASNIVCQ